MNGDKFSTQFEYKNKNNKKKQKIAYSVFNLINVIGGKFINVKTLNFQAFSIILAF